MPGEQSVRVAFSCSRRSTGHEVVATIVEMHLHPNVMPKLCDILDYDGECHLAPANRLVSLFISEQGRGVRR